MPEGSSQPGLGTQASAARPPQTHTYTHTSHQAAGRPPAVGSDPVKNQILKLDVTSDCSAKLSSLSPGLETAFYRASRQRDFTTLFTKFLLQLAGKKIAQVSVKKVFPRCTIKSTQPHYHLKPWGLSDTL